MREVVNMDDSNAQGAAIRHALARAGTGVCISCGKPVDSEAKWPRCRPCQRAHDASPSILAYKRAYYAKRRAAKDPNLCVSNCCQDQRAKARSLCPRHLKMNYLAVRRYKAKRKAEALSRGQVRP